MAATGSKTVALSSVERVRLPDRSFAQPWRVRRCPPVPPTGVVPTNCGYLVTVDDFLSIYLRDQRAMGVLWRELARRAQRDNRGTTLRDHAGLKARLPDVDFDHLIDRAARQRADLEPFRTRAGTGAFTTATAKVTTPKAGR